jgi:hypothetical protein
MTYFKAIRPDGTSFHDPSFTWATEPGGITRHPGGNIAETDSSTLTSHAAYYLSVSTVPTDCTGMHWPCRLLEVEPVGDTWQPDARDLPNKVAGLGFRTVRELPAHEVFGPQGALVVALIDRASRLSRDQVLSLAAAWYAAWDAARDAAGAAARDAAWDAAWDAARDAAGAAAWTAAGALIVRDLVSDETYRVLTASWESVMGPIDALLDGAS